ncbi:MAG: excinuclease ABC subunit UvrB [bacterium]
MNSPFNLESPFDPKGDQPRAIEQLLEGLQAGDKHQTLLGATGTGKTYTIANVIQNYGRPTLVMAPNKTLAAQLFNEFTEFFPNNAVEYFVSYYDYYQPEAYIPSTDTYIEKDSSINDRIDLLRHRATASLLSREDVIIVASVSCIYGLGSAEAYYGMLVWLEKGMKLERNTLLRKLVDSQYERNDRDFHRGTFRVRGDIVEIFPAYESEIGIRVEFFGDEVESIWQIDPLRGKRLEELPKIAIYPNSHHVVTPERKKIAIDGIRNELKARLEELVANNQLVEAQRLEQRTQFDLENIITTGSCSGIENYSRHFSGRNPGEPPPCLLDYFPKDFLVIVDESHVTIPQIGGMYRGDRARKETLVSHGFRLPSAMDNRPLKFDEWEDRVGNVIFVSATPSDFELTKTEGVVVEQIIRPTGLLDPKIEIRPAMEQVDDLYGEIRQRVDRHERVLVTTLTKVMAQDLTEYLTELGVKTRYLHSDIDTIERMNIIRDLRKGVFDVLIGINLLREGLDIPEVSLVGILDADKEGFLRSARSLIQTIGRAARNVDGTVILYADRLTDSMQKAIEETNRRRAIQEQYNLENGITPKTIIKRIHDLESHVPEDDEAQDDSENVVFDFAGADATDIEKEMASMRQKMRNAADNLDFEGAARYRDHMKKLEVRLLAVR